MNINLVTTLLVIYTIDRRIHKFANNKGEEYEENIGIIADWYPGSFTGACGCSSSTSKEKDDGKGGSSEAKGGVLIYGKGGDAVVLTQLS